MRSFRPAAAALLAALALPARAGSEDSLRCPGGLVAIGDPKIDLLGRCGEPTLREATRTVDVDVVQERAPATGTKADGVRATRTTSAVERWTYDFGRSQFVRIVTLEGGRVVAIESGGRGYSEVTEAKRRPLPIATCDYKGIRVGDTAYEVLTRCGEPATRDVRLLERTVDVPGTTAQRTVTIPLEVWAYHFGPQTLTRIVELEDGKVARVETGTHGYPAER